MYAFCPKCKAEVEDHGGGGELICKACGHSFKSRTAPSGFFEDEFSQEQEGVRSEDINYNDFGEPLTEKTSKKDAGKVPVGPEVMRTSYKQHDALVSDYTDDPKEILAKILGIAGFLCFFILFFFNIISLGGAIVIVLPKMMEASPVLLIPVLQHPYIIVIGIIPEGYPAVAYFIFIISAILISFFWMVYDEGPEAWQLLKTKSQIFMRPFVSTNNSFFLLAQFFLLLLFINAGYYLLLLLFGVVPDVPESLSKEQPLWKLMYGLANASVWEELAARVLFIGIPLGLFEIMCRKYKHNKRYDFKRYLIGGKMKIGFPEGFFIAVSAVLFGLAHVSGWDWWKFGPTFISGLVFGYLFVARGLHVAILLHFAIDYLSIPLTLFNVGIIGQAVFGLSIMFLLFIGLLLFIIFFIYCVQYIYYYKSKLAT